MRKEADGPFQAPEERRRNRLVEVTSLFLRLGFTAFGGPAAHIAMMRQEIVKRHRWLSDERFVDLLSVINLIPGPNSTQLAIYLGFLRAGWLGLIAAGVCFIGPAMLIVLTLAWLYVRYGSLPQTSWLFYGIKPVVIAIIAQALWGLCRTILKGVWPIACALLVVVLYLVGVQQILLLFGAGLCYAALRLLIQRQKGAVLSFALPLSIKSMWEQWRGATPTIPIVVAASAVVPITLSLLFLTFLKIGSVVYGSGYVLLAFLRNDLVLNLHWLSDRQLLDAVSIGQFTPGPVFTTATFIGYLLAGWPGALVATLGIFLPSFVLIAIIHPLAARLRSSPWTAAILDGVNIAALALMAGVLLQLGQSALTDVLTWTVALVSLVILLRFKINSVWLIVAGAALGLLRFLI
ncbi:MAG: chromate efflux transporter [Ktedonobacteraceae bacterium]|nr:chromate efflux transporter [Ktedonobacteraceae bacterium]MBV9020227.1 chromate efflux transporter [Ktedonobacteraceae bacterium]